MINVLQLCAGQGSRFREFSDTPKPFLPVGDDPMFIAALKSLQFDDRDSVRYHFLFQQSHVEQYNPAQYLPANSHIYTIDYYTDGAATSANTVIANSPYIDEEWMTIDSDFILEYNKEYFLSATKHASVILSDTKQWDLKSSYSCTDEHLVVYGVAEKQPVSKHRNTGLYHWKSGRMFSEAYNFYKENALLTNGEFYLAPLYNYIIQAGARVKVSVVNRYIPIGTPADYTAYIATI